MGWLGDGSYKGQGRQAWTVVGLPPHLLGNIFRAITTKFGKKIECPMGHQGALFGNIWYIGGTMQQWRDVNVSKAVRTILTISSIILTLTFDLKIVPLNL